MFSREVLVFLGALIVLVESGPLASEVNNQVCLAEHVRRSGSDPKPIYKDEYNCKPLPRDEKSANLWPGYLVCARDFKNGTCILDLPYIRSVANDVQFEGVSKCAPAIVSTTLPECAFEFVDCYMMEKFDCNK